MIFCLYVALYKIFCTDINECELYNDCHQECSNTIGSYQCNCKDGFILNNDTVSCRGL